MDAHTAATQALQGLITDEAAAAVARLVGQGTHAWCWDPEVEGVLGLRDLRTANRADMVVYLDTDHGTDFEANEEALFS